MPVLTGRYLFVGPELHMPVNAGSYFIMPVLTGQYLFGGPELYMPVNAGQFNSVV
jgi:hypothetical protein